MKLISCSDQQFFVSKFRIASSSIRLYASILYGPFVPNILLDKLLQITSMMVLAVKLDRVHVR